MSEFSEYPPEVRHAHEQAEQIVDPGSRLGWKLRFAFDAHNEATIHTDAETDQSDDSTLMRHLLHQDIRYMNAITELDTCRTEAIAAMALLVIMEADVDALRTEIERNIGTIQTEQKSWQRSKS